MTWLVVRAEIKVCSSSISPDSSKEQHLWIQKENDFLGILNLDASTNADSGLDINYSKIVHTVYQDVSFGFSV